MQRNLRAEAEFICCLLEAGPHLIKIKEAKSTPVAAWDVFLKLPNASRGRKVATLIAFEEDRF